MTPPHPRPTGELNIPSPGFQAGSSPWLKGLAFMDVIVYTYKCKELHL